MGHKRGKDRGQLTMIPFTPGDYIDEGNPCRAIDTFVDALDLVAMGFRHAATKRIGCNPYSPWDMLKLYIYGYMYRIHSSRRLEAEAKRNVEVMWLLNGLVPDDKTICNFRADNQKALREVFRMFNKMCINLGLFGCKIVAVDGTKIKANNSRKHQYTKRGAEEQLLKLDKKISVFMNEIDSNDAAEANDARIELAEVAASLESIKGMIAELSSEVARTEDGGGAPAASIGGAAAGASVKATDGEAEPEKATTRTEDGGGAPAASIGGAAADALKKMMERKSELESIIARIDENGGNPVCTVDGDAAMMKQGGGKGFDVCYNVQTAVDEKNGLIAHFEVTNHGNDICELSGMAAGAKEELGVDSIIVLGDKGYSNGREIAACEAAGDTCLIPKPEPSHQPEDKRCRRDQFIYDAEKDIYTCPEGNEMPHVRTRERDGFKVYANRAACNGCPSKELCTKSKTLREIERNPYQEQVDSADANAKGNKGLYDRRMELSEHPFGVVKRVWGYGQYLCRGKGKVEGETSLMFLAFNFRRALNIMGVDKLREAMIMSMATAALPLADGNEPKEAAA